MNFFDGMDPSFSLLALVGVATHSIFFRRIDSVEYGSKLALAVFFGPAIIFLSLCFLTSLTILQATFQTTVWTSSYTIGLITSMIIYRLFFHPLGSYPGPLACKITQWYYVWKVGPKLNQHWYLESLHKQFGEYVRIGPNAISVADPAIVEAAFGPHSKFTKSNWYRIGFPITSLQQITDVHLHERRRKHGWDKAFSASSLRSYDMRIMKYAERLVEQLESRVGQDVDMMTWLSYFAFDFMGDLAFGTSFAALESGHSHWWMDVIRDNTFFYGIFGTVPWLIDILLRMPVPDSMNAMKKIATYSNDLVEKRKEMTPAEPDVMSHILEEGPFFNDASADNELLKGDARLLVIAGSDTTAATLTFICHYLARDSTVTSEIRKELLKNDIDVSTITAPALTHLPYLNAVINETLRLHPPVPSGVYRNPPCGGTTISGRYLPEGCVVFSPQHVIHRSKKAFNNPLDFTPERWTTKPELINDKNAFYPFSLGKFGCIGKQLAYNEIRMVTSLLVLNFDLQFAPDEDGSKLLFETQDQFTLGLKPLHLILRKAKET